MSASSRPTAVVPAPENAPGETLGSTAERHEGVVAFTHIPTAGAAGKRRRTTSISTVSPAVKPSVSTPQMSGSDSQDSGGLSPSTLDKRRNKLGYQRISIACAHCRRRKIRCVLAESDSLGRCSNCIRLKKECVFHPVDDQNPVEGRLPPKPGLSSKSSSLMSPSPSELRPGRAEDFSRFATLPSNAPHDFPMQFGPVSGFNFTGGSQKPSCYPTVQIDPTSALMESSPPAFPSGLHLRQEWAPRSFQSPHQASHNSSAPQLGHWQYGEQATYLPYSSATDASSPSAFVGHIQQHQQPYMQQGINHGLQPPLRSVSWAEPSSSPNSFRQRVPSHPLLSLNTQIPMAPYPQGFETMASSASTSLPEHQHFASAGAEPMQGLGAPASSWYNLPGAMPGRHDSLQVGGYWDPSGQHLGHVQGFDTQPYQTAPEGTGGYKDARRRPRK